MQRQNQSLLSLYGSRESFHEWWSASYTTHHQQPWLGVCLLFCAGITVSNCCVALGCDRSRTSVSEDPGWVQGAGSCCPAGVGFSMWKRYLHYTCPEEAFLLTAFFVEPSSYYFRLQLYCSPIVKVVHVSLLVKGGDGWLEVGPKLDLWIQTPWNSEKSLSPILSSRALGRGWWAALTLGYRIDAQKPVELSEFLSELYDSS